MWILKIGGSWIKNRDLDELLNLLDKYNNSSITLVVGGGCFADSVREAYDNSRMTEESANFLALKATEIFAYFLKEKNRNLFLSENKDDFLNGKIKIWLPSKTLSCEATFVRSWQSTSDSVAAWLSSKISSSGVIFIKSLPFLKKKNYSLRELQKKDILDKNVDKYLLKEKSVKIVGPEIIDYLRKSVDWKNFIKNLSSVSF